MPKSDVGKEVIINIGHWLNWKLSLGLHLNGTSTCDASPENLVGELVSDSHLPQNDL